MNKSVSCLVNPYNNSGLNSETGNNNIVSEYECYYPPLDFDPIRVPVTTNPNPTIPTYTDPILSIIPVNPIVNPPKLAPLPPNEDPLLSTIPINVNPIANPQVPNPSNSLGNLIISNPISPNPSSSTPISGNTSSSGGSGGGSGSSIKDKWDKTSNLKKGLLILLILAGSYYGYKKLKK